MSAEESRAQGQNQNFFGQADESVTPEQASGDSRGGEDPDVILDVQKLNVEELNLELKDLRAHISLRAELSDLVKVNVGVDAYLDEVKLETKGIEAQAVLKVDLERVLDTFDRALKTIDRNPEILGAESRTRGVKNPEERSGSTQKLTSLGETTDEVGNTVRRYVDVAGNLMDTILDGSGEVTDEVMAGNVEDLNVEREYVDEEGRTVILARDDLGRPLQRTLDENGNFIELRVPEGPGPANGEQGVEFEATTAARAKAGELGLDLSEIRGSGSGGRILVKDVEDAAEA